MLLSENGDDGRLGHSETMNQLAPKLVEGLEGRRVVRVVAGAYHSLLLAVEKGAYNDEERGRGGEEFCD